MLRTAVRDGYRRIMAAVDPDLVEQAESTLLATPGVLEVRAIRMRWIGHDRTPRPTWTSTVGSASPTPTGWPTPSTD